MSEPRVIVSVDELRGLTAGSLPRREEPLSALLCPPDEFDVVDVKNPHMEGQVGKIDREQARGQWLAVKQAIEGSGRRVHLLRPLAGVEDMVFTANPVLPGASPEGELICLLSNMTHASRKKEVAVHEAWFRAHGYRIERLPEPGHRFEGQGDALWHPGLHLLWGGFGFRTVPEVYRDISGVFSAPVILLELVDERLYHLDTCLCPLSETEALYYPPAFTPAGRDLVTALFPDAIEVPEEEATAGFACNPLVLGRTVLIQQGNVETCAALRERGYEPLELETSEFMKSGGSVFCMKMMVHDTN